MLVVRSRLLVALVSTINASAHRESALAADVLLRWPADEPLAALVSGGANNAQNTWSIFARPRKTVTIAGDVAPHEALQQLNDALATTPRVLDSNSCNPHSTHDGAPPFAGGWVVALGYELGACFEPRAQHIARVSNHPRAVLHWCPDAWCLNHATGALHAVGAPPALASDEQRDAWQLDAVHACTSDAQYGELVARTVEHIHAGDAFQASIARRFEASLTGSARAFAHAAITENRAWFGALIELPCGGAVISMSPELFLRVRRDGSVVTRPIKGTRPHTVCSGELIDSEKDAAELAMIVDLMRNDLGRVAEIGSVAVTQSRVLETHRTVHHGVAEIYAQLRDDVSWMDLLRATFPPGSVTGAPKVRAMQIIDELENAPRGFYCGAIGFISHNGEAALNVAIRTAQVSALRDDGSRVLHYHAGCGIVAQSEVASEIAESHAKTRALVQLSRGDLALTPREDLALTPREDLALTPRGDASR